MKRTFTKQLLGRTAMLLLTLSASLTAMGGAEFISGSEGPKWELADGTLTISGTGAMPDFTSAAEQPWANYRSSITRIIVESGVTVIGAYAFNSCSAAVDMFIGSTVTTFHDNAFVGLTGMTDVYCDMTSSTSLTTESKYWNGQGFKDGQATIFHVRNNVITAWNVTYNGNPSANCTFQGDLLTGNAVVWTKKDTKITLRGFGAIKDYYKTSDTTRPTTSWSDVTEIVIAEGITRIGNYAFIGVGALTTVNIPASVTSIGKGAFQSNEGLTSVTFADNSQLTIIDEDAFKDCYSTNTVFTITLPESLETIGGYAFKYSGLENITIPSSVKTIGSHSFYDCPKLTSANIYGSPKMGTNAFEYTKSGLTVSMHPISHTADGKKWTTFYNTFGQSFLADDETQVFKAAVVGGQVVLTELSYMVGTTQYLEKKIAKNNAVILRAPANHEIVLTIKNSSSSGDYSGNALVGTMDEIETPTNCYTLANGKYGVGFYKYSGDNIAVGKAYLVPTTSSRSFFEISTDDETTAVDAATKQEANDEWYTLDGRRMKGQPTKAGVYVKKNKVVVIK